MVMNPRTHARGAPPDFTLPRPNPNPQRMTDALWWLVCMREALEPALSQNGGTYARKPGYHNNGAALPDYGQGDSRTDHSIRRAPDRTGPWWKNFTSAHDWTFVDAQRGNYATISLYTKRLINAMRDPHDLRPDDVYAYTLGQIDNDRAIEGYNEYRDDAETSSDDTHTWHRHDAFRRNIIGSFPHMWQALTIDMGWTYAEWQRSVAPPKPPAKQEDDDMPLTDDDIRRIWAHPENVNVSGKGDPSLQRTGSILRYTSAEHHAIHAGVQALSAQVNALGQSLMSAINALARTDFVDEKALAAALAPGVAVAVVSQLPADRDDVSPAELQEAFTAAIRNLLQPS